MNLSAVALLPTRPQTGNWYRVTDPRYLRSAISTTHTSVVPSRFYDPYVASPQFGTLYLSDHPIVAQFEAQVLLGSPLTLGGSVPAPRSGWVIVRVAVSLSEIVDLSDLAAQAVLDASVQELTGDWEVYRYRSPATNVKAPVGTAPTQHLGEAIHRDTRTPEGFLAVSARVSNHRNLVVFPDHLRTGSYVEYEWEDQAGTHRYRVDRDHQDGTDV